MSKKTEIKATQGKTKEKARGKRQIPEKAHSKQA
jgi:hypothetical protein